jgi:fructose-1,6-bisphosphatase/inositol monophosphatase family enzyme
MRFTIADALRVGEILSHAGRTEIMPKFGTLTVGQVREKSTRFDIVTVADEAAGCKGRWLPRGHGGR